MGAAIPFFPLAIFFCASSIRTSALADTPFGVFRRLPNSPPEKASMQSNVCYVFNPKPYAMLLSYGFAIEQGLLAN